MVNKMFSTLKSIHIPAKLTRRSPSVLPYLLEQGHKVLNIDLVPFPYPKADIYTLKADLTQSGQAFNALTSHFNMSGYAEKSLPQPPDVVIHFAAYPCNMIVPDNETFQA
jgi:hypothetical protein